MWLAAVTAIVFAGLLFFSFRRAAVPDEFRAVGRGVDWLLGFRPTRKLLAGGAVAVVAVAALSTCVLIVPPGQRGLVRRFGSPVGGVRGEGLHFMLPPPIGRAKLIPVDTVRRIELGFRTAGLVSDAAAAAPTAPKAMEEESLFLTGDENLVNAKTVVQYRITDPVRYAYAFDDPETVIKWETVAEALEVLAAADIDGIYTHLRAEVEKLVLEGVRRRCDVLDLGVEILQFGILDVHPPPEVHAAFRDVASSQEDKQTAINVARRYFVETVNLAHGEAAREVEIAHGYAHGEVSRAQGESKSLELRSEAFRKRPSGNRERLYLETVEQVLEGSRKIIRPGWEGAGGTDLWISTGGGAPAPVSDVLRGSDVRGTAQSPGEEENRR